MIIIQVVKGAYGKMTKKILQKIRSVIYSQREGNLTEEEAYKNILKILYKHQANKLVKRL